MLMVIRCINKPKNIILFFDDAKKSNGYQNGKSFLPIARFLMRNGCNQ